MERILASSIREQGKNLGPVIEESEGMRVDAGRIAERIEVVHKELSLQPVGEVEGMKLQQWVDLVRVILAKLYSYNNG